MGEVVWHDGVLVPAGDATVSAFDHGLTVGDGVFETLRAIDGAPFAPRRHLERLRRSVDVVGLELPWTDEQLRAAVHDVLAPAPGPLARVRITVTSGPAPLGPARGDGPPTVLVAAGPMAPAEESVAVCTASWPRNERDPLTGVKSTSFGAAVLALTEARARGGSEALFANTRGELCEGTASSVFVVVDEQLRTPPLSSGCLPGVTRALLLGLVDVLEEDLSLEVLESATEVFLTSTGRGVQPVHRIDGRALPAPGPLTARAMGAFAALVARNLDP